MPYKKPLVSIIITCYNYGKYVEQAAESAFNQTFDKIEVIIINDGSTDNSDTVCKKIQSKNKSTRYFKQENRGIVYTRNRGIEEARGDYLLFLDADDYLDTDYVENTLAVAQKHSADIVYTDFRAFGKSKEVSKLPEYSLEELKNHNFIHISALVRRKAIGENRFDEQLSSMTHEDWDFFLGLCLGGAQARKCPNTYLNYRIHDSGRNNTLGASDDRIHYANMFMYITDKYANMDTGRERIDFLAGRVFAPWFIEGYHVNNNQAEAIKRLGQDLDFQRNESIQLAQELQAIKRSKTYKYANKLGSLKRRMTR